MVRRRHALANGWSSAVRRASVEALARTGAVATAMSAGAPPYDDRLAFAALPAFDRRDMRWSGGVSFSSSPR